MQTYQGSCHCKRVRFEVDLDLSAGTTRCNCTSCFKRRWWSVRAKPANFRLQTGREELVKSSPDQGPDPGPGGFCRHCGIVPFYSVAAAEWNDGAYVGINVAALDGLDPKVLAAIPITYLDGLHDTWQPITELTSYL
ncbi:MAG TPA: hypothetical protein VIV11_18170 [Kofleriaceae bacterium]